MQMMCKGKPFGSDILDQTSDISANSANSHLTSSVKISMVKMLIEEQLAKKKTENSDNNDNSDNYE